MGIVSYAQNFEDVILWRVLADVTPGIYIDVGAQHPIVDSVSKAFYEHGWRGIHVEPTGEHSNLLRVDRPDDTVIQAALSDQPGVIQFYEIPGGGLSTARREIAETHEKRLGCEVVENLITAITLDSLFELTPSDTIHWLKIDVEGFEREVLSGWRDSPRRPWVVVIESTYPNSTRDTYQDWEHLILSKGYELAYRDGLNRFYLHHTQAVRQDRFEFPPNVFDGFQLSGTSTSFTTVFARTNQETQARMMAAQDDLSQKVERERSNCQKRMDDAQVRQQALQQLVNQTLAYKQASAIEQLKELAERERVHAEKVDALREMWRQTEAELAVRHQQAHEDALEHMRRLYERELANLDARLAEACAALEERQREAEYQRADLQKRADDAQGHQKALEQLVERTLAHKNLAAIEHLKALAERDREHGEEVLALRAAWRQTEAELTAHHEKAQQELLEKEYLRHQLETAKLNAQLAEAHAALEVVNREAERQRDYCEKRVDEAQGHQDSMRQLVNETLAQMQAAAIEHVKVLTERDRTHREALEALRVASCQAEAELTMRHERTQQEAERQRDDWQRRAEHSLARQEALQHLINQTQTRELVAAIEHTKELTERDRAYGEKLDASRQRLKDLLIAAVNVRNELIKIYASRTWRLTKTLSRFLGMRRNPSMLDNYPDILASFADIDDAWEFVQYAQVRQTQLNSRNDQRTFPFSKPDSMTIQHVNDLLNLGSESLVDAAYQAILGRAPDTAGRAFYLNRLKSGTDKIVFVVQLASSQEGQHRSADLPGLRELVHEYRASRNWLWGWWSRRRLLERTMCRLEWKLDYLQMRAASQQPMIPGEATEPDDLFSLSDEAFVRRLYRFFLNREPEGEGRFHYLAMLRDGQSRWQVMMEIAQSEETKQRGGAFHNHLEESVEYMDGGKPTFVGYSSKNGCGEKLGVDEILVRIRTELGLIKIGVQ